LTQVSERPGAFEIDASQGGYQLVASNNHIAQSGAAGRPPFAVFQIIVLKTVEHGVN
jgi:hypothetical protein